MKKPLLMLLLALAAGVTICGPVAIATTGCAVLEKDPQFAQDAANLSKCVADAVNGGTTDALVIAAKCFGGELKMAYDFIAGLLDLPSFLAAVREPAKIEALKQSHFALGAQLAARKQ